MAGFADLVPKCNPAYFGAGHTSSATAGRTWSWPFDQLVDNAGDPIDLTSVAGTAKIVAEDRTTVILSLDFTGTVGGFTVSATKAATAGLFSGADYSRGRICYWYLTLDDGTRSVQIWLVDNSPITIRKGA